MTDSTPEHIDIDSVDDITDDQPAASEQAGNAGLPGPDDEIQVTGHVLGPGDGEAYDGPATAQQDDSADDEA